MNGDKNTKRVFFSFHVPEKTGLCLLSALPDDTAFTLYPKENLHLTLKFIGDVDAEGLARLKQIASEVAAQIPPIEFLPTRFVLTEERIRAEAESGADLRRLYTLLVKELGRQKIGRPEPHPYVPHITLARATAGFDIKNLPQKVACPSFSADAFELFMSEPGEDRMGRYTSLASFLLRGRTESVTRYQKIVLPTRTQPDTLVAIFILKKFGEAVFPGIKEATVDFWQTVPEGETTESLDKKGIILFDLGGGRFDHHGRKPQTTASDLVAEFIGVKEDPSLAKLLEYARRDDFYGKGTISSDPLDRAFGLSALVAALNKSLVKNPGRVVDIVMPILVAHHNEEVRRTKELPQEFETKLKAGEAETFEVKQRDKKLKVVIITSASGSLAGYLRSQSGGKFDVVAQWLPSGHVNILTRPTKRVDLRSLAAVLRMEEATLAGTELEMSAYELSRTGRVREIPEWYYDPATNSIQNGGLNPTGITPTKISKDQFRKILELGLSEKVWDPRE